jgi:hypothetical protein
MLGFKPSRNGLHQTAACPEKSLRPASAILFRPAFHVPALLAGPSKSNDPWAALPRQAAMDNVSISAISGLFQANGFCEKNGHRSQKARNAQFRSPVV